MKPILVLFACIVTLPAWADDGESFTARAKVVRVEPQYEWVKVDRPTTKCWDETIYDYDDDDYGDFFPALLGGAVGGALGHQMGGGRGKDVATVAGAIAGTVIGQRVAGRHEHHPRRHSRHRCKTKHHWVEERHKVGYLVTYRFAGRTFTTFTNERPGKRIDVRVNLDPLL